MLTILHLEGMDDLKLGGKELKESSIRSDPSLTRL